MKHVLLALLTAAVSGCATAPNSHNSLAVRMATAPNQGSFLQDVAVGVRRGLLASSGAVIAVSANRPREQHTQCSPDYIGGFTCVTREQ